MDFSLSPEHLALQARTRDYVREEVIPDFRQWERQQEMNPATLPRLAELGLMGVSIPKRYGGAGLDYLALGIVCEELERGDSTLRVVMSVHAGLNSMAVLQWGTEAQKQRFLVPQARGEKYAAFSLTEPDIGSDAQNILATAQRHGDMYLLNGRKKWISIAKFAHHFLVIAKTDPDAGAAGMTAFMVERGTPGFDVGEIKGKLGVRAGSSGTINMVNAEVPAENRIGEEGEGFKVAMSALDNGRYTVAAGAAGLIRACLEDSLDYAQTRQTFGVPIVEHQLVQQKLAYMQQWYDSAQLHYYKVAWLKNQGIRNTRETSIAKWYNTDHAVQAALEAVQVHGANGYTDDYNVERYLRNSKGAVIYEGTSEIHQLMQAAYLTGKRVDKPLRCELPAYNEAEWQLEAEPALGDD
ncbi:MAG: acyl-CoA dehydrogenase family protein [Phototrophicaceae bacterium]